MFVALRVDFDLAAAKAVNQQAQLQSTSTTLNTVTIGLIAWAVAVSIAISVMITLIVRRMRVLRARAKRLAAIKHRRIDADDAPYDAEFDSDIHGGVRMLTEADYSATSVVDMDLSDGLSNRRVRRVVSSLATVEQQPQHA